MEASLSENDKFSRHDDMMAALLEAEEVVEGLVVQIPGVIRLRRREAE
jgi:hypothetical protein